jgi:hypothetical protein
LKSTPPEQNIAAAWPMNPPQLHAKAKTFGTKGRFLDSTEGDALKKRY